jgi:prepilin-type processing-associated H-X9-DG protein/prepilin-type N-terminal cleavage/methylation domain-containing protein
MSASYSGFRPAVNRRRRRRSGGFTLVELLVVLGILVLIASILIPVVSRARGQAVRVQCVNQMKNLGHAITLFAGDHNATLPTCGLDKPTYPTSTDWIGWGGTDTSKAPNANVDYMDESGLAKYLGAASPLNSSLAVDNKLRSMYRCPAVTEEERTHWTFQYDYAFNAQLSGLPLDRIQRTGETGLLIESDNQNDSAFVYSTSSTSSTSENIAMRHKGNGANCLFVDGHVDSMDPTNVAQPPAPAPANPLAFTHWDAYYTAGSPPTQVQDQNDPTKPPPAGSYETWH